MNKIIMALLLIVPMFGCQPREEGQSSASAIPDQRKEAAKKMLAQSVVLLENKDLPGAVSAMETSIKIDPSNPEGYLLLGQILLKAEQFDRASGLLDQAAKTFPDNGMVFYMLSVSNKMAGRKLPAALAARHSFDLFKAANDVENAQKSAVLLEQVLAIPDNAAAAAPVALKKK